MIPIEQREQIYGYAQQFLSDARAVRETDPQAHMLAFRGVVVAALVLGEGRPDEFRQHLSQIIDRGLVTVNQMFPDNMVLLDIWRSLFSKIMPINRSVGMPETGLDLLRGISEGQYFFTDAGQMGLSDRAA